MKGLKLLRKKNKFLFSVFLFLAVLLIFSISSSYAFETISGSENVVKGYTNENAKYGGILKTYMGVPPRSLDIHMEMGGEALACANMVYNGLLRIGQSVDDTELDLAESWEQTDDLTYVFKLYKGVKFHNIPPVNGRELTSADVKYSIERMSGMYGKGNWAHSYYFKDKLESIETPDKYTVIFKTKKPYAPFIRYIASGFTKIVPKEAVDAWGDLKKNMCGTGAFIYNKERVVPQSRYFFKKNPDYFKKGLPYLDEIDMKIIFNPQTALSAYIAGELDWMSGYPHLIPALKKSAPDSTLYVTEGTYVWILRTTPWIEGKKPLKPPFKDKRVRQAIAHAIDKKELLKLAWFGAGATQVGPIPNVMGKWALPESEQVEYNPEKAKKLLAEAGYPDGFSTDMITFSASYTAKAIQVIQQMLEKVGIKAELKSLESAQYFNRVYTFNYNLAYQVAQAGVDPSEWLVPYYGKLDTSTYYKWSNHTLWDLIEKQEYIMDEDERVKAVHEIQKIVLDEAMLQSLFVMSSMRVERNYLHRRYYIHPSCIGLEEETWLDR